MKTTIVVCFGAALALAFTNYLVMAFVLLFVGLWALINSVLLPDKK